ncbi:hypothetical protein SAMN04489761_0368 [Tenacibaculum sp. MAR_2009_124]|uniref:hypothetical protein n=1 Tax=Tenacibaculum sp. MAR_2009_124 TaxID=1250059 RepID=UPI000894C7A1|nr:hypothetical protein [Tenacibaculum sp. MAR_2009_124]SEB38883.1 hypothetical protein SAMN04489761_0368 [Tenacibaculum sp. MAR_2009_124]
MRYKILIVFLFAFSYNGVAQMDANSLMGLPRGTTAEINAITSPNEGSIVYNSEDKRIYKFNGTIWVPLNIGNETKLVADSNISITGEGTDDDPYVIRAIPATLTENPDGSYTFSNGVDADVTITPGVAGNTPIVSGSNSNGGCANQFETNQTKDVVITGDYFDGSATVFIAGQTVNSVTVNSVNQLTANVTAGSTTGNFDISVTTNAGTGTLPSGFSIKVALVTYNYGASDITLSNQMSYTGGNLIRTAGTGWNQQGYSLVHNIPNDSEGHLNFTAGANNRYRMVGLNSDPAANASYSSIDYAIYLVVNGRIYIYENGGYKGNFTNYVQGDQFKINVACDGTVTYLKNGTVFYTSTITRSQPLYLDSSFYNSNGGANNISITY